MRQIACNATFEGIGQLNGCRYVLHDRDAKFCPENVVQTFGTSVLKRKLFRGPDPSRAFSSFLGAPTGHEGLL
jgi:hypothetical protein